MLTFCYLLICMALVHDSFYFVRLPDLSFPSSSFRHGLPESRSLWMGLNLPSMALDTRIQAGMT